jgi:LPS O-antigen subunit length determinant protein (WzzB/FepE family)
MKKNFTINSDEIDLIATFKIIWDGKKKMFLITIISFLIALGYLSQIPRNYLNILDINPSNDYELKRYKIIRELLNLDQSDQLHQLNQLNIDKFMNQLVEKFVFELEHKFITELKDYEEFLFILKSTKKVQEDISKLKIDDQEINFFNYARLLEVVEKNKNYTINFKWHDPEEAIKILQDTLNLTSNSIKRNIINELKQELEYKKKSLISKDVERLDFLKEQSIIAKELNITDNQIDNINLSQSSVSLSINTTDIAYYLRGYRAIDKEIELIQNRKYQSLKFIEQEINDFQDLEINFVDYNVFLIKTKSLKETKFILLISVLVGLIIGVCFVLISNATQSQTISKKTRKKNFKND